MRTNSNPSHPLFVLLAIAITVILLGAGILVRVRVSASQAASTDPSGQEMATAVRIAHIERRAQSLKADFHGFLLPMTRLSVSAHVAGEIVQQWVEISDQVEAGQALFKIDDALRAIEYRQAQASLARAQSQHELAVANWKRIESMSDQASSSMERIGAQTQLKAALADQQRAEATVRQAALLLERTTVHSPIDGVVSDIYLREGEFVQASQPLAEVIEVERLKLVAEVEDRDVVWIKPNHEVVLTTDAWPGQLFSARVSRVYPRPLSTSRKFQVEIELNNAEQRLRPGFFVQGTINGPATFDTASGAGGILLIPREAVVKLYGQHFCYVAQSTTGQARLGDLLRVVRTAVEVLPIRSEPRHYQLVGGAAEGDMVVTKGISHLLEETTVRVTH